MGKNKQLRHTTKNLKNDKAKYDYNAHFTPEVGEMLAEITKKENITIIDTLSNLVRDYYNEHYR